MKRILIADDERIERQGIRMLLGTISPELEIFEAANGKRALEMLKERKMDILLTDIRMPFMTGLELAREARQMNPDIQIAIFSAFGEFAYAQEAIRYGVTNYILKPVKPAEFRSTMEEMFRKSEEREKDKKEKQSSRDFRMKYYLQRYLMTSKKEYLDAFMQKEGKDTQKDMIMIQNMMLLEAENGFFEEHACEVVQGLEQQLGRRLDYLDMNENQILLLFYRSASDNYARIGRDVQAWVEKNFRTDCFVAVSRRINGISEGYGAYQEAELLMENKFFHTDTKVFLPEEDAEKVRGDHGVSEYQKRLKEDIRLRDFAHLWADYRTLLDIVTRKKMNSQMYLKFIFSELVKDICEEAGMGYSLKMEDFIEKIYQASCLNDICGLTEEVIRSFEIQSSKSETGVRNDIQRVKQYIAAHLSENLSTDILAAQVYLSPGYLSYIFKKETGTNLSRYIRECRMEKAKELLRETNMKIVQICREVGFANVSYFCQNFREYYGVSPEKYRKGEAEDGEVD